MKDAGLRIRVQRDLRNKFLEVCRAQDKPASQVIREFVRNYVGLHEQALDDGALINKAREQQGPIDDD